MNIHQSLTNHENALDEIMEYFGGLTGWGPPEIYDNVYWRRVGNEIWWWLERPEDIEEAEYSNEIYGTAYWPKEEYTMVGVFGDGASHFLMLFNNELKVEEDDNS